VSDSAPAGSVRLSLKALLDAVAADPASAFGYAITAVFFGETCEFTFAKNGKTFVLWLRPATAEGGSYRDTQRFKIGHRHDPPDRLGYALLNTVCARIKAWEGSLPRGADAEIFASPPKPQVETAPQPDRVLDTATQALLSQATFSPIYEEWLPTRERQLAAFFRSLTLKEWRSVLLVNATRGLTFYPSIVDFFALWQRTHDRVRTTCASYFDEIFQFHRGVADKGLPLVSVAELMGWKTADVNRFDLVLFIGPSDVMARLMALDGLTAKLVMLDLGFYHQLIEFHPAFMKSQDVFHDRFAQVNRVVVYSCQPEAKITHDLEGVCLLHLLEWRWLSYIPIGFAYSRYYRSDRHPFDVGLLGSAGRDYSHIDPDRFRATRFLFVGEAGAPGIEHLNARVDLTIASRVDEDTYARLLALCKCVVLPTHVHYAVNNVFLSVLDTIATGKPLVTPPHPGLARLERDDLPAVFYDATRSDLSCKLTDLLDREERRANIEALSITFAKERLDIYGMIATIVQEQLF
jgi:hypothetical protein